MTLRRGKTDQEGWGRLVTIPRRQDLCPVAVVETWLAAAGIEGPVFRSVNRLGYASNRTHPARANPVLDLLHM